MRVVTQQPVPRTGSGVVPSVIESLRSPQARRFAIDLGVSGSLRLLKVIRDIWRKTRSFYLFFSMTLDERNSHIALMFGGAAGAYINTLDPEERKKQKIALYKALCAIRLIDRTLTVADSYGEIGKKSTDLFLQMKPERKPIDSRNSWLSPIRVLWNLELYPELYKVTHCAMEYLNLVKDSFLWLMFFLDTIEAFDMGASTELDVATMELNVEVSEIMSRLFSRGEQYVHFLENNAESLQKLTPLKYYLSDGVTPGEKKIQNYINFGKDSITTVKSSSQYANFLNNIPSA